MTTLIEKIVGDRGDKRRWRAAGEDPVEFAETFFRNHFDGQWISKLCDPSLSAIERAEAQDGRFRS